ncbi:DUF4114 domain-containing protein [Mastigocoleus testarum]|uniref:DUF4114 domain-containing protein n=1 Tax=Mastigocoleus testarum BC008 TaxID=371196 RepID=A0A0V7ZZS6_9CYAN|nr:DUF4114 domain-containing protein [Mastigocoleus testarum]KST70060.1 hypothetical protein BC008_06360 [Mastigocoleus testarum BC008]KST70091.1 hypothetical protein BC008_06530 [Mastigocoleus testarum BC008]
MAIITVTNTKNNGVGSLREAIAKSDDGDKIVFSPKLADKTIRLDEQLVVDKNLTIDGGNAPNLTISGENKTRILQITYDYSDVVLRNLTFANGKAVDDNPDKIVRGGAIELVDSNTLVVENSRFIDNVGERSGAIFVGYGSNATIKNSVFDGNDGSVANDDFSAGAISTYGGGEGAKVVKSNGERNVGGDAFLKISDSTFTNNKGYYGAVYTLLNELKVEDSVFKDNEGLNGSGAIFTDGASGSAERDGIGGTTLINNVVAENNKGGGDYGGAFFLSGYSDDKIIVENSKITNNKAYRGGGLAVQSYRDEDDPVSLVIRDSTIANNTSTSQGGGLWTDVKGGVTVEDSTFSENKVTSSGKNGDIGGAIVLNTPKKAKSTIKNTTFVENYADRQAGSIWIAGKDNAKNLTITESRFADNRAGGQELENTVNFVVKDGGKNVVQNKNGVQDANDGEPAITGAKLTEDLDIDPITSNGGSSGIPGAKPKVKPIPQPTVEVEEPNPTFTPVKDNPLHYEAEELNLNGYRVENIAGSNGSGGKYISLKKTGYNRGSATGTFRGEAGTYQVKVGYYDENDGQSQGKITVGGKTESFIFDRDLPSNLPKPSTKTSYIAIEEVQLKPGDIFKIEGVSDSKEFARFDEIEFIPTEKVNNKGKVDANEILDSSDDIESIPTQDIKDKGKVDSNGIIDLSNVDLDGNGKTDDTVSVSLDKIFSRASYKNSGGFYQVLDTDGTVVDPITNKSIRPGETGYETAAFKQRISELDFNADDRSVTTQVDGGIFLAPYLIADGTVEEFLEQNPTNQYRNGSGLHAYFGFENGNPDGIQHLQLSNNKFGFEDVYGGGDRDFLDLTFNVNVEN